MTSVGTYEAKTNLPELLHRAEAGESITITRNGRPVAKLVPFDEDLPDESADDLVAAMRKIRSRVKKGGPSIRAMIRQGRRY